jgi:hypothetical protein
MSSNHNNRNVTSISTVAKLERRLQYCRFSEDYVVVIRALVATGDRAAIRVLASLLDSVGPIAEESIAGLLTFGEAVVPAMRECIDSLDYEMIRHGHRVLAGLGDAASRQWLRDDDAERIAAYLERKGFSDVEGGDRRSAFLGVLMQLFAIANETDAAKETA